MRFILCSFRSVVGTLWAVADKAGPIISKAFYNHMFKFNNNPENKANFRDPAKALNLAVRAPWKERAPLEDSIAFVHIGDWQRCPHCKISVIDLYTSSSFWPESRRNFSDFTPFLEVVYFFVQPSCFWWM